MPNVRPLVRPKVEGPAGVRNDEPRISFLQEDPQALPFELMEQKPARLVDSWITGRRAMWLFWRSFCTVHLG